MKYIGNAFSAGMVENNIVKFEEITKSDFIQAGKTAKSVIGHPEIAKVFGLELNRESIKLQKGDVMYIVTPANRPMAGKTVEDGAKYKFIPEEQGYSYKKVTVIE